MRSAPFPSSPWATHRRRSSGLYVFGCPSRTRPHTAAHPPFRTTSRLGATASRSRREPPGGSTPCRTRPSPHKRSSLSRGVACAKIDRGQPIERARDCGCVADLGLMRKGLVLTGHGRGHRSRSEIAGIGWTKTPATRSGYRHSQLPLRRPRVARCAGRHRRSFSACGSSTGLDKQADRAGDGSDAMTSVTRRSRLVRRIRSPQSTNNEHPRPPRDGPRRSEEAMKPDRRSAMFRRPRVLRNGLVLVSASALATSLIAAVPAVAASPSADIAVTDSPTGAVVPQGGFVTYTAAFRNLGPDAAQNVVMKTGGTLGSVTASPGVSVSCVFTPSIPTWGIVTCTTPSLPSGDSVTISVPPHHVFYFHNQCGQGDEAWATSDTFDPNLNNNVAYATIHRLGPCF